MNKTNKDMLRTIKENRKQFSGLSDSDYTRGEHPNSLKNLKPFPKGVSGNPMGKPHKYQKLADKLNKIGNEEVIDFNGDSERISYRESVLKKIWRKANHGDLKFIQMLAYLGCLDD